MKNLQERKDILADFERKLQDAYKNYGCAMFDFDFGKKTGLYVSPGNTTHLNWRAGERFNRMQSYVLTCKQQISIFRARVKEHTIPAWELIPVQRYTLEIDSIKEKKSSDFRDFDVKMLSCEYSELDSCYSVKIEGEKDNLIKWLECQHGEDKSYFLQYALMVK